MLGIKRRLEWAHEFTQVLRARYVTGLEPPNRPLLDPDTLAWMDTQLRRTSYYLEFGCGGTTLLANSLGIRTLSVESDAHYAEVVRRSLPHPERTEVLAPDMGVTGPWGMPVFFATRKGGRYVRPAFQRIRGEFPDLIFVDGRYRVACVLESANQAERFGARSTLLLDDYVPRAHYRVLEKYLGPPEIVGRAAIFRTGNSAITDEIVCEHLADPR